MAMAPEYTTSEPPFVWMLAVGSINKKCKLGSDCTHVCMHIKVTARIRAVSPEPMLFAHLSGRRSGPVSQRTRYMTALKGLGMRTGWLIRRRSEESFSSHDTLTHFTANRLSYTIYWKSLLSILGTMYVRLYNVYISREKGQPICKQWRPWSDAAFSGVWSVSALFANYLLAVSRIRVNGRKFRECLSGHCHYEIKAGTQPLTVT